MTMCRCRKTLEIFVLHIFLIINLYQNYVQCDTTTLPENTIKALSITAELQNDSFTEPIESSTDQITTINDESTIQTKNDTAIQITRTTNSEPNNEIAETTQITITESIPDSNTFITIITPESTSNDIETSKPEPSPETTTAFIPSEENCHGKVQIEHVIIKTQTAETLEIEWKTTENYQNCVEKVNITWTNEDLDEQSVQLIYDEQEMSYNIMNLEPCRTYNINLKLIGSNDKFVVDEVTIDGTTESIGPSSVEVKYDVNMYTINLSWTPNENEQYCISGYNITYYPHENSENSLTENVHTTTHTIVNLSPCTEYDIEILPISVDGQHGDKTSDQVRTLADVPDSVKLNVTSKKNTISLKWKDPERAMECVKGYQISCKLHHAETYEIIEVIEKNKHTYEIKNLKYCNEYDVEILPIGEGQNGTVTRESTATEYTDPSAVQDLKLSIINENSIQVAWDEPKNVSECVEIFQLNCTKKNVEDFEPKVDKTTEHSYIFRDLDFCTEYEIKIIPVGKEQDSNGEINSKSITTDTTDVDEVGNLVAQSTDPNTIFVEWDAPSKVACVNEYNIICISDKINFIRENKTKDLNFTYINLQPCIEYNITVEPIAKGGKKSKQRSIGSTTLESQPSEVTKIKIDPLEYGINISWKPPKTATYCVQEYEVQTNGNDPEKTESENILIKNLNACMEYNFTITPIVSEKIKGKQAYKNGETLPSVSKSPILQEYESTSTSVALSYELDISNNLCELKTAITICKSNKYGDTIPVNTTLENTIVLSETKYEFEVNVEGLKAFTEYTCNTSVNNIHGRSDENSSNIKTLPGVPSKPILKTPSEISTNAFIIVWEQPESIPGDHYSEILEIHELQPKFFIPSDMCAKPPEKNSTSINITNNDTSYHYTNALPYTEYAIKIHGITEAGDGPDDQMTIITDPSESTPVRDMSVQITYTEEKNISYPYTINLTWLTPCNTSGILEEFLIQLDGYALSHVTASENKSSYSINLETFKADHSYTVEVFALTKNPKGESITSTAATSSFITPAGVPSYIKEYEKKIFVTAYGTNNPEHKAEIKFSRHVFNNEMGNIKYYSIIVSRAGFEGYTKFESWNDTDGNWIQIDRWSKDHKNPYQATSIRWNPFKDNEFENAEYIIGDQNCQDTSDEYCNGPLRSNTNYSVRIRGFTNNGFSDTPSIYFQTAVAFDVGVIIAVVISLFIFGTCLSFAIYFKNGNASLWIKSIFLCKDISTNGIQSTVMPPRISIQNFPTHCLMLRSNENQLSSEFSLLETLSDDIALLTYTGDLPHNRVKNRYPNIKPYDVTRVKLRVVPDEFSDYINASYIKGYSGDVEYIATQGPKEETVDDFWQMVYENDVKQIVMVTNLTEKGKGKCYKYYPEELDPVICTNGIELECEFIEFKQAFTMRHICLKKKNHPYIVERKLIHIQFHEWPDFGVPQSTDSVLKLCRKIRSHQAHNYGVVAVHCSAGVGRTGTIIAIDILVQAIHANRKIDVFGTVFNLRKQRQHMVKNEGQYAFIYSCLKDEIINPRVFQGGDPHSSYTSFYDRGYYSFYDDGDLRKLSTESAM